MNNINGGLECPAYHGGWHGEAIKLRLNRYCKASHTLGLDSILIFDGCKKLNESYAECLGDGTCPYCRHYDNALVSHTVAVHSDPIPATLSEPESPPEITVSVTPEPTHNPTTPNPTPEPTPNPTPQPVETATVESISNEQKEDVQRLDDEPAPACPGDLKPVDGLPGCCVTEPAYHGDGACDPDEPFNTAECMYDGGDCCRETCDLDSTYGCSADSFGYGPFGYYCINPSLNEYINPEACTVSDRTRIGDGRCDEGVEIYNTEACNWDGGDCCMETCNQRYAHFDCGDPAYPYSCQNPAYAPVEFSVSAETSSPTSSSPTSSIPTSSSPTESSPTESSPATSSPVTPSPTVSGTTYEPTPNPVEEETKWPTSSPAEASETEPLIMTVLVSEDAYIMKGSPTSNHGLEQTMKVKGLSSGPNAHDALMRFIIPPSGLDPSTPVDAVLKIYSVIGGSNGGLFHVAPESGPWSEALVNWNNAPDWDARIGNIGHIESNQWYTLDVSEAIGSLGGSGGAVTIRVRSRNTEMVEYSSKEGLHAPEIIVAYGAGAVAWAEPTAPPLHTDPVEEFDLSTATTPELTPNPTPRPTENPTRATTTTTTTTTTTSSTIPGVYYLNPSDDATIVGDHPNQNYGLEKSIQVDDDSGV